MRFKFTLLLAIIYGCTYFARGGLAPLGEYWKTEQPFDFCTSGKLMWTDEQYLGPIVLARFVPMSFFQATLDIALLALLEDAVSDLKLKSVFLLWILASYGALLYGYMWLGWGLLRGTGWFAPTFYFPTIFLTCSSGITPILMLCTPWIARNTTRPFSTWVLLITQSIAIGANRDLFWLCLIGFLIGWIIDLALILVILPASFTVTILKKMSLFGSRDHKQEDDDGGLYKDKPIGSLLPFTSKHHSPAPGGGGGFISMIHPRSNQLAVVLICAALMTASVLYSREVYFQSDVCWTDPLRLLASGFDKEPWFVVALPTIPRVGSERYLINTIDSMLLQLPEGKGEPLGFLRDNFKIVVVNNMRDAPENHTVYQAAAKLFSASSDGRHYVKFIQTPEPTWLDEYGYNRSIIIETVNRVNEMRIHFDVATALHTSHAMYPGSEWFLIQEDDFELCPGSMNDMLAVMCDAVRRQSSQCGVFLTTGGSGIVIRKRLVPIFVRLLINQIVSVERDGIYEHSDLTMQRCLKGDWPECSQCAYSLLVPSRCLFKHIGIHSARNTFVHPVKYTCEWRHPFAGNELNVSVVLTPR